MLNRKNMHKLRHFEFNCDQCCLKNDQDCPGDKEFCAIKYDHTVIREHHISRKKYKGVNDELMDEVDFSHGIPNEPEVPTDTPKELCGQGRCMECPRTLC